jgi:Kef-type K+ transport system membrane component KefB
MHDDPIIFSIFLIFTGAAIFAAIALFARQSLLVAYILLGGLAGPWGFKLVHEPSTIQQIGHIRIIFLLFLLGLNLQPAQLVRMLREAVLVTVVSSPAFAATGTLIGLGFGFSLRESLIIGSVMMFSSTIIGLKLLPTTALHHRHVGQVMISILLLQDIFAIAILVLPVRTLCPVTPDAALRHHPGVRLPGRNRLVPRHGTIGGDPRDLL